MPTINRAFKEISCKIVYYGPGLGGKTTNLQIVHRQIPAKHRGELVSLATEQDRTLFFDFLPLDLGEVKGFKTKFQLYTVPGQVFYNATRKLVLRGVDGLVFVADSQIDRLEDNVDSLNNLNDNLQEYGLDIDSVPLVLQYNKRDLPDISSVNELERALNPASKYPSHEAVAIEGIGVKETLKSISGLVLARLNQTTQAGRGPLQQSRLAEAAARRRSGAPVPGGQSAEIAPSGPGSSPSDYVPPRHSAPSEPQPIGAESAAATAAPVIPQRQRPALAVEQPAKPKRIHQEGRLYRRGLRLGSASLEFAHRKNSDNRGEYQLSGIVKSLFKKRYWFKMLDKAEAPPESQSNADFDYFREREDSGDRNPRIEVWVRKSEPAYFFVREVDGNGEIAPYGQRLKHIL